MSDGPKQIKKWKQNPFPREKSNPKKTSFRHQAPEKHQVPSTNLPDEGVWNLVFGVSLELGAWSLAFFSLPASGKNPIEGGQFRRLVIGRNYWGCVAGWENELGRREGIFD